MKNIIIVVLLFSSILCSSCLINDSDSKDSSNQLTIILFSTFTRREYFTEEIHFLNQIDVLVTDMKGNPVPNKRVDWEIIQGDGNLGKSSITYDYNSNFTKIGVARIFYSWDSLKNATIKAIVFGYNANVVFSIENKME